MYLITRCKFLLYILRVTPRHDDEWSVQLTLSCAVGFHGKITMRRYPRLSSGIPRKRSKMPGKRSWMPTKLSGVAGKLSFGNA